jgi:hypothetical protein
MMALCILYAVVNDAMVLWNSAQDALQAAPHGRAHTYDSEQLETARNHGILHHVIHTGSQRHYCLEVGALQGHMTW